MPSWLPLLNYSTKYNISLSTLRRRIKAQTIEFRLDQGKYLILDEGAQMPLGPTEIQVKSPAPQPQYIQQQRKEVTPKESPIEMNHSSFVEASVLTSANRLVEEIKSAYAKILQEKEEQISQLKEEIVDLRMLVRILEDSSKTAKVEAVEKQPEEEVELSPESDYIFGDFQNRRL